MITQSTRDILTSETILQKMKEVQVGKPWYGTSVEELLCRVDPNFAFERSPKMPYSIASLLAHMIYWKKYASDVLEDNKAERDQQASFSTTSFGKPGPETWFEMIHIFKELNAKITKWLDENMIDPYEEVKGTRYNLRALLEGITEHDIYHVGQIALLTKYFQGRRRSNPIFRGIRGLAIW